MTVAASGAARRLLWVAGVTVSVLVLFFYGAGGWYFAGQIQADGLAVETPKDVLPDVEVASVTVREALRTLPISGSSGLVSGSLELQELPGSDGLVLEDETLGLAYDGGFVQLDAPVSANPLERTFALMSGDLPEEGVPADVTQYVFPDNFGEAWELPVHDVRYSSPLGAMDAWYVPGGSGTWAVLVHGRAAPRTETVRAMVPLVNAGHPIMSITYRNDPGQPEDPSGFYRYGFTEWEDLDGAVRYALDNGAEQVILLGNSTGGAIIVSFMYRSELAEEVSGIVLDSPNLDFGAAVSRGAADRSLPGTGLPIPESLVSIAKFFAELRYGIDFEELDYLSEAAELDEPILVLHGTGDEVIPIEVSRRLTDMAGANVRLVEFEDAQHVRSWNSDPLRYEGEIARFIRSLDG